MTYAQMHPAMQAAYDRCEAENLHGDEREAVLEAARAEVAADKDWTTPPAAGPCHGDRTSVTLGDGPRQNV